MVEFWKRESRFSEEKSPLKIALVARKRVKTPLVNYSRPLKEYFLKKVTFTIILCCGVPFFGLSETAFAKNKSEKDESAVQKKTRYAFEERFSYNTDNQFQSSVNGVYGFTPEWFGSAGLGYGRTPITVPKGSDQSYSGTVQAGYNTGMWGVDGGVSYQQASVSSLLTKGFQFGVTFAYFDGLFENKENKLDLLKASNTQIYQSQRSEKDPIFWCRVGVQTATISSKYLADTTLSSGLKQMALSADFYYPVSSNFVYSGGGTLYGYTVDLALKSTELYQSSSSEVFLIANNLQGLPGAYFWNELSYQITNFDSFLPRLQTTLLQATKQWQWGGTLSWRRRVISHLYITPSYELSALGSNMASSFQISFFHDF